MSFSKVHKTTGELTQIAGNGDIPIDSVPTEGSAHAVQSGGTFSAIKAVSDDVDELSSQMQALGTAASKDSTTTITQGSTDLPEAGAVYSYIDTMITSALNAGY